MIARLKRLGVAAWEWMKRVFGAPLRLGGAKIGARLTACFLAIVLSMIAADFVAVWQFSRTTTAARQLTQADQTSLAVVRVHLDVDTFRDKLAELATTHDIRQFTIQAASVRRQFVEDIAQSQQLLHATDETQQDPAIRSALETLRIAIPSQLDTATELASANDWPAVRLRLAGQVQELIGLSSSLVEKVDREVSQQRAEAIESGHRARRQLILIVPFAALLTLLAAVSLGWYATRSITDPLSELEAGARALAAGDFRHQVAIDGQDELAQLGKVFNDTARQLAALYHTLRSSEARLRLAIDTIPAYVWSSLPDGSLDFINRRWLEFSGLSLEQGLGWGWETTVHPGDLAHFKEEWRVALASGKAMECEARVRRADGQYRWLLIRNVPLHDETGDIVKWYGTSTDIDDRKRAEEAREEMEEQWRAAFESNPTMYFIVDAAGVIVRVNEFGAEKLGYSVAELRGRSVLDIFYQPDRAVVQRNARECFERPGHTRWEARKIRKDGTMLWVRETANAVYLKKRPVLLVVCEDITEQKRAEEAARRSARELRDAIETIPAMVFSSSPDGANTFVNGRWAEFTGFSLDQTAGSGWRAAVHPDDVQRHLTRWRTSLATAEPFEDEVRFRNAGGQYRWHLVRGLPLRDEQGNILKWYGNMTDIEDRRRAEGLLAGEKRILEMLAKGNSLSEILDSLCRLVEEQASGVMASILLVEGGRLRHGAAPSLPKAYTDATDGLVIGPSASSCGTAAYRGLQVVVEEIAIDPLWTDYRDFALSHSLRACWSTPIFSAQGNVIATFAMYYREPRTPSGHDRQIIEQITNLAGLAIERKMTQDKLQRSESYLAEAERLTHTGSWGYNPATAKTTYWSEEIFRIFELDPKRGIPPYDETQRIVHPEDRAGLSEVAQKAFSIKADFTADFRIVLTGGTVKHLHVIWHPILDENGDLIEYRGTAADVTERKRAEKERERLRQVEEDLAHINRVSMMGELAASLAHEIKQPIAAAVNDARTCLRWLRRETPDVAEACETASRIVNAATRAANLIDRVRSLYKRETPQRELVEVNDIIRDMIALLYDKAYQHSIAIHTDFAAGLPAIAADRVQLQQVLMNLILNGIEAMKEASGRLTITSGSTDDGELLVSVSDSGTGLPVAGSERIFEAFFTTKPQGTGMGLSISRRIIESHGGRLWATSGPTGGATFHFTLPTRVEADV